MLQMNILKEEPSSLKPLVKFMRRPDLDSTLRLKIATSFIVHAPRRGKVTDLAAKYDVTRQFIYNLKDRLKGAVEEKAGQVYWYPSRDTKPAFD